MNAPANFGGPKIHADVEQGSEAWLAMRQGVLTASEMKHVVTPTLKIAANDKSRAHELEIAAQRISAYVEPHYISSEMIRGQEDELLARSLYAEHFAPVTEVGFITNDRFGFILGYSPDGLVGDEGAIEAKSRRQRFQVETIAANEVPAEFMIQLQTGLLVSERKWIDFISYSGGLPMFVKRVEPIAEIQEAIITAACAFEARVAEKMLEYRATLATMPKLIPTERRIEMEIY